MAAPKDLETMAVWDRARHVDGQDPRFVRADSLGNIIFYGEYGNRESEFGWEVDHVHPTSLGGIDHFLNKQPLHWRANTQKSNKPVNALAGILASTNREPPVGLLGMINAVGLGKK